MTVFSFFRAFFILGLAGLTTPQMFAAPANADVTITETSESYTLDNGIIEAIISKRTSDLISMKYKGLQTLELDSGGHSGGYWSHDVTGADEIIPRISIDPTQNGGEMAEVSIKGVSNGVLMGHGPGTPTEGDLAVDIDIRWALKRGEPGVYTYTAFEHPPEYESGTMAEARIAVKLMEDFDHLYADKARSGPYPLLGEGIDKYVYTALQAEERAFGWTSAEKKIGWFLLNPSAEYLSGGPTKAEFLVHGTEPTVLSYWKSSHYYGANVSTLEGEHWTKVIGPFMFYVNEGEDHEAMVADAKAKLKTEEAQWPYAWVDAPGYALAEERGTVKGRIALSDAGQTSFQGWLQVGLSKAPYQIPAAGDQMRDIEWQNDGKFYQFWNKSTNPDGSFEIPNVSPGTYTLHAFAEGVLGEFSQANVTIEPGQTIDLGDLNWTPRRFGEQVWEIGIADRTAMEFNSGPRYFEPGIQLRFNEIFPDGVTYTIGESTPNDWFFAHFPTPKKNQDYEIRAFVGIVGDGVETPYTIEFDMPDTANGIATLRMALTSTTTRELNISVNGTAIEPVTFNVLDAALMRHQMYGRWFEKWVSFDADLLKAGKNTLTLTLPAGQVNASLIYDYLRLELDPAATTAPPPPSKLNLRPRAPVPAPAEKAAYEIRTPLDDTRFGLPAFKANGRVFVEGQTMAGEKAIFIEENGQPARELITPAHFNTNGTLGEWRPSPDGRYVAWSEAIADPEKPWRFVYVYDVDEARKLHDELWWVLNSDIAWSADSKGFYYSRYNPPNPNPEVQRFNTAQSVFYHRLGDDRYEDRLVYTSDRGGMIHIADTSSDGRWVVINGSIGGNGHSEIVLIDTTEKAPGPFKAIRSHTDSWQFAGSQHDDLFFVTTEGARTNRRLVLLDTSQPSLPIIEVVPERAKRLQAARLSGDDILLSYGEPPNFEVRRIAIPKSAPRAL